MTPLEAFIAGDDALVHDYRGLSGVCFRFRSNHLPSGGKGNDKLPRKNVYYAVNRRTGGLYRTKNATAFVKALAAKAMILGLDPRPSPKAKDLRPLSAGWWRLELLVVINRRKKTLDVLVPDIDADACLSPVKDALQYAGLLDDDGRIVDDHAAAVLGPQTELRIRLRRIEDPNVATVAWPGVSYLAR